MISAPDDGSPSARGVLGTLADAGVPYRLCSYGKVALGAALDALDATGNVLLPACIPHGVVGPILARGLEPRFYRVRRDLQPRYLDLVRRIDGETAALLVVHYFGVSQPRFDAVASLARSVGVPVIDDNSHAVLSRRNGRLLGTSGTFGFASLHKSLPVPNGAVLYAADSAALDGVEFPTRWTAADLRYCAGRTAGRLPSLPSPPPFLPSPSDDGESPVAATPDPLDTYAEARVPLSPLVPRLLRRLDPERIVARRRAAAARWANRLDGVAGVQPLYDEPLAEEVCPWAYPVVCDDPDAVVGALDGRAFVWPRLPPSVAGDGDYPVANEYARRLVALPAGQDLGPEGVDDLADALEGA